MAKIQMEQKEERKMQQNRVCSFCRERFGCYQKEITISCADCKKGYVTGFACPPREADETTGVCVPCINKSIQLRKQRGLD